MPNSDRWKEIAFSDFNCDAFRIWKEEHLVLAAGDFAANEYNAMAVGGGFLGFLWGEPAVMVLVRPQRRTFELLERYDTFTLSVFDSRYRDAVAELGAVSGRDVPDKLAAAGFTAVEARAGRSAGHRRSRTRDRMPENLPRRAARPGFLRQEPDRIPVSRPRLPLLLLRARAADCGRG